jgi:hypothetical protein
MSGPTNNAPPGFCTRFTKAASISRPVLAFGISIESPNSEALACSSFAIVDAVDDLQREGAVALTMATNFCILRRSVSRRPQE